MVAEMATLKEKPGGSMTMVTMIAIISSEKKRQR
jgi:hypothetical protein